MTTESTIQHISTEYYKGHWFFHSDSYWSRLQHCWSPKEIGYYCM